MRFVGVFILGLFVNLSGCITNDADRCMKGYTWEEGASACIKNSSDNTDTGTEDSAAEGESRSDAGAADDSETGGSIEGLGALCTASGDECAEYPEASYCAVDPRDSTQPGYCTVEGCAPGECPSPYLCCNCFSIYVYCVPEDGVAEAAANGCECS